MYIYVYIDIYVCIIYIHMCAYIHVYIYLYTHIYVYIHLYIYTHLCDWCRGQDKTETWVRKNAIDREVVQFRTTGGGNHAYRSSYEEIET